MIICSLIIVKFVQSPVADLRLIPVYRNEYHLVTSGRLDREQTSTLSSQLICRDRGQPLSLKTVRNVVVMVTDVNDNAPRFTQTTYDVDVVEHQLRSEVYQLERIMKELTECVNPHSLQPASHEAYITDQLPMFA